MQRRPSAFTTSSNSCSRPLTAGSTRGGGEVTSSSSSAPHATTKGTLAPNPHNNNNNNNNATIIMINNLPYDISTPEAIMAIPTKVLKLLSQEELEGLQSKLDTCSAFSDLKDLDDDDEEEEEEEDLLAGSPLLQQRDDGITMPVVGEDGAAQPFVLPAQGTVADGEKMKQQTTGAAGGRGEGGTHTPPLHNPTPATTMQRHHQRPSILQLPGASSRQQRQSLLMHRRSLSPSYAGSPSPKKKKKKKQHPPPSNVEMGKEPEEQEEDGVEFEKLAKQCQAFDLNVTELRRLLDKNGDGVFDQEEFEELFDTQQQQQHTEKRDGTQQQLEFCSSVPYTEKEIKLFVTQSVTDALAVSHARGQPVLSHRQPSSRRNQKNGSPLSSAGPNSSRRNKSSPRHRAQQQAENEHVAQLTQSDADHKDFYVSRELLGDAGAVQESAARIREYLLMQERLQLEDQHNQPQFLVTDPTSVMPPPTMSIPAAGNNDTAHLLGSSGSDHGGMLHHVPSARSSVSGVAVAHQPQGILTQHQSQHSSSTLNVTFTSGVPNEQHPVAATLGTSTKKKPSRPHFANRIEFEGSAEELRRAKRREQQQQQSSSGRPESGGGVHQENSREHDVIRNALHHSDRCDDNGHDGALEQDEEDLHHDNAAEHDSSDVSQSGGGANNNNNTKQSPQEHVRRSSSVASGSQQTALHHHNNSISSTQNFVAKLRAKIAKMEHQNNLFAAEHEKDSVLHEMNEIAKNNNKSGGHHRSSSPYRIAKRRIHRVQRKAKTDHYHAKKSKVNEAEEQKENMAMSSDHSIAYALSPGEDFLDRCEKSTASKLAQQGKVVGGSGRGVGPQGSNRGGPRGYREKRSVGAFAASQFEKKSKQQTTNKRQGGNGVDHDRNDPPPNDDKKTSSAVPPPPTPAVQTADIIKRGTFNDFSFPSTQQVAATTSGFSASGVASANATQHPANHPTSVGHGTSSSSSIYNHLRSLSPGPVTNQDVSVIVSSIRGVPPPSSAFGSTGGGASLTTPKQGATRTNPSKAWRRRNVGDNEDDEDDITQRLTAGHAVPAAVSLLHLKQHLAALGN